MVSVSLSSVSSWLVVCGYIVTIVTGTTTTTTTTTSSIASTTSAIASTTISTTTHTTLQEKSPKIQSFHLLPSAQHDHLPRQNTNVNDNNNDHHDEEQRQRRLVEKLNKENPHNAIYSLLPKQHSKNEKDKDDDNHDNDDDDDDAVQDFHAHRHLSRYERHYRTTHQLNLHSHWNGHYDSNFTIPSIINNHNNNNNNINNESSSLVSSSSSSSSILSRHHSRRRRLGGGGDKTSTQPHEGGRYNNYQHVPLSQGYGTHYAHVWIGTPTPSRHSVIVDTGSHFTALPCKGCDGCGEQHHTDPYYDFEKSTTFQVLQCPDCQMEAQCQPSQNSHCVFSQSYTEGSSWEAYQVQDTFYCAGNDVLGAADPHDQEYAIPFMFGCQTSETGLFVTQLADGIMGMSAHEATLPNKMYKLGKLEHNLFTMCFRRELQTSKQGVTAGTMTLGGIDTTLDSSPMVYAQNMAQSGWYTVHVQNIFIRTNGGQSASLRHNRPDQHIMKIPLDLHAVNSGKGVIVDSGTTDTYLNTKLADSFNKVWKQVIGREYTHSAISLTQSQLMRLPTILIQMKAYDSRYDPLRPRPEHVIGRVGSLDPQNPNDVLIAIPATNYMEYSPQTDQYTTRLYFTETSGGVIGANAMQGHNVLFDWENSRVGFAESTCQYTNYHNNNPQQQPSGGGSSYSKDEREVDNDCVLSKPTMNRACIQSVDLSICENEDDVLQGTERWTLVVENAGTPSGMSCIDAAILNTPYDGPNPPLVECDGNGLCYETRPCQVNCHDMNEPSAALVAATTPKTPENNVESCGPSLWGACDYSCTQSRVQSIVMADNICHETSQDTRPCHVGACGRSDPCKVPFVVHAIMVFYGADAALWDKQFEERLSTILTEAAHTHAKYRKTLFKEGDVNIMATSPWYVHDEAEASGNEEELGNTQVLGIKAVVEISIFNAKAHLPKRGKQQQQQQKQQQQQEQQSMADRLKNMLESNQQQQQQQRENSLKEPVPSSCSESELYPLATTAMEVQEIMGGDNFVQSLLVGMRQNEEQLNVIASSPFQSIYNERELAIHSRVVSSWTIQTEIADVTHRSLSTLQRFTLWGLGCFVVVGTFVFLYRVRYSTKLGDGGGELYQLTSFESAVIDGIRSRLKDAGKGHYKEVGTDEPGNDTGMGATASDEDILELIMSRSMSSRGSASSNVSDISDLVSEKAAIELVGRRRKPSQKH